MSKRRLIDEKIRSSQSFSGLNYRQRDLWQGLIETADDQGRMPGVPTKVRSLVWSYDDISPHEVASDLKILADQKFILLYSVNGFEYLQIINWWVYQTPEWAGKSDHPSPEGWTDRIRYHGKGNVIISINWDKKGGFCQLSTELPTDKVVSYQSTGGDVNGDVNGGSSTEPPDDAEISLGSKFASVFVQETHIPELTGGVLRWTDAIRKLIAAKVTPEDLKAGIHACQDKGYSIVGLHSVVNPAIVAMQNRLKQRGRDAPQKKHLTPQGEEI